MIYLSASLWKYILILQTPTFILKAKYAPLMHSDVQPEWLASR